MDSGEMCLLDGFGGGDDLGMVWGLAVLLPAPRLEFELLILTTVGSRAHRTVACTLDDGLQIHQSPWAICSAICGFCGLLRAGPYCRAECSSDEPNRNS